MTIEPTLQDRFRGVLLGSACGDALGGPVEFVSREDIRSRYPNGLRDFVAGGWLELAPGEITDDTQMTIALAESLVHGDDIAARWVEWLRSNPKDVGGTTRAALQLIANGVPWQDAGLRVHFEADGRAAGNGSVMRCAPVAMRYCNDREALRRVSLETSAVTHADPRCTWGTVVVNQGITWLLNGGSATELLEVAVADVTEDAVAGAVLIAKHISVDKLKAGGFVLDTISAAFWAVTHHETAEEAIVAAVNLGSDSDTTGAVAGALAGARWGAASLPERWLDSLQPREHLTRLADSLYELATA